MTSTARRASVALIALAAGLPAAQAHILHQDYFSQNNFLYQILHVPDIDQVRNGLPNTGLYYCVPTSHMNFAAYIADHGYPAQQPGSGDWTTVNGHLLMTGRLATLGQLMNTNPTGGTSPSNAFFGNAAWFTAGGTAVVSCFEISSGYTPRLKSMAARAADGSLIVPRIGWYDESNYPVIARTGGHCVSMVYARADNSIQKYIGFNDPGSDEDNNSLQSGYTTDHYVVQTREVFELGQLSVRTMSRIKGYGGSSSNGYIYGFYCISPVVTLVGADTSWIKLRADFVDANRRLYQSQTPGEAPLRGLALSPDQFRTYFLTEQAGASPAAVWQYDTVSEQASMIAELLDPVSLCTGRGLQLYVADGRTLRCFTPEHDEPSEVSAPIPSPVEQVMYDDAADQVVCLSQSERQILRFDAGLGGDVAIESWPTGLTLGDRYAAALDASTGAMWVADTDNNQLFMVDRDKNGRLAAEAYTAPTLTGPMDVAINDLGQLIVACDGSVRLFRMGVRGQLVDITAGSGYEELASGAFLAVGRSRTNIDPASYGGPDTVDVVPTNFQGRIPLPRGRYLPAWRP